MLQEEARVPWAAAHSRPSIGQRATPAAAAEYTHRHVSPQIPPPPQRCVRRLPVHRNRWSLAMALALFWPTRRLTTVLSDGIEYPSARAFLDG